MTPTNSSETSSKISQPSSSVAYINTVLDAAESIGVDRRNLQDRVALSPQTLNQPNERVPMETLLQLLDKAAAISGDESFGLHVGPHIKAGSFGLLGYLSMCSRNIRENAELMLKFRRIAFDAGQTLLHEEGPNTIFSWYPLKTQFTQQRYLVDAIFSGWACFSRLTCGDDLTPCRTEFSYPKPDDTRMHQQLFGENVHFSMPQNRMFMSTELLDRPHPQANPAIFDALNQQACAFVQELNARESTSDEVRHILYHTLPQGDANIDSVAASLNINRRTLQRKLSGESTNFKLVLNELREDLAEQYLKDQQLSVLDVALLLGFSDNSAFTTAFKSWKSMTPSQYRRTVLGQDESA